MDRTQVMQSEIRNGIIYPPWCLPPAEDVPFSIEDGPVHSSDEATTSDALHLSSVRSAIPSTVTKEHQEFDIKRVRPSNVTKEQRVQRARSACDQCRIRKTRCCPDKKGLCSRWQWTGRGSTDTRMKDVIAKTVDETDDSRLTDDVPRAVMKLKEQPSEAKCRRLMLAEAEIQRLEQEVEKLKRSQRISDLTSVVAVSRKPC